MPKKKSTLPDDVVGLAKALNNDRYFRKDLSYGTWYVHDRSIQRFSNFLQAKTGSPSVALTEFSTDLFSQYLDSCVNLTNAKALVANCSSILNAFGYAAVNGLMDKDTVGRIYDMVDTRAEQLSVSEPSPEYLREEKVDMLKAYWRNLGPGNEKDSLDIFFFSLHANGMGFSDIMTLQWNQIDFESKSITVSGPEGQSKSIPMDDISLTILKRWKNYDRNSIYVFNLLDPSFKTVLVNQFQEIHASKNKILNTNLASSFKSARIVGKISFQMARHTFVARMLQDGVSVKEISKMLGHATEYVTKRTYNNIINELAPEMTCSRGRRM